MYSTIRKAVELLELLAESPRPLGVSELARQLGWPKSNVYRVLDSYAQLGYVQRVGDPPRYEPTLRMWEFGTLVHSRLSPISVAQPILRELASRTGETSHLSIFQDDHVVYVDQVESPHPVRAYSRIGGIGPAYCTATGKAMLAHLPDTVVQRVMASIKPQTRNTIVDKALFLDELATVRRNGFALANEEWQLGVSGIAAPVFDSTGNIAAALGVSGPADRLTTKWCREAARSVVAMAQSASGQLGYQTRADARA